MVDLDGKGVGGYTERDELATVLKWDICKFEDFALWDIDIGAAQ